MWSTGANDLGAGDLGPRPSEAPLWPCIWPVASTTQRNKLSVPSGTVIKPLRESVPFPL